MFAWIKEKIGAAWRYSRTVFLNVVAGAMPLVGEVVSYLANVDWTSLSKNPRVGMIYMIVFGLMNIVLRFMTTAPVGNK